MVLKRLDEIAEIFNGVRLYRYKDKNGVKEKVFIGKPSNSLTWQNIIVSSDLNQKFYSKKNDIIIHLSNFDIIEKIEEEGIIIPMHYAVIRLKKDYNPTFIYYLLQGTKFQKELNKLKLGSILQFVKLSELKNIKIDIPSKKIQNQYGELFQLMDRKLTLKNKQNELIKKYKNTLLTKIGE